MNKEKIELKRKLKSEKGSITLIVLISCLFFISSVVSINIYSQTKKNAVEKEISNIKANYEKNIEKADELYNTTAQKENLNINMKILSADFVEKKILANISGDISKTYAKNIKYGWLYTKKEEEIENLSSEEIVDWNYVENIEGQNKILASKKYEEKDGFYYLCLKVDDKEYWEGTGIPCNEYEYKNNVNRPILKQGMIPVKYEQDKWVIADVNNLDNSWYDYSKESKKWANIVTVKENGTQGVTGTKTRSQYLSSPVGTEVKIEDITTFFVWIPRFSYKITSGYHEAADGTGNIEISFLMGKTDIPYKYVDIVEYNEETTNDYTKFPDGYVVHPAFTSNTDMGGPGEEITGFWVGKFESSNYQLATNYENNEGLTKSSSATLLYGQGDGENITIKPNVTSWRYITVSDIYTKCQNMNSSGNIHGLNQDTTTTMMQNSQWGAVAYLTQSDSGNKQTTEANSGVWNNTYCEGITTYSNSKTSYAGFSFYGTTLTGMVGSTRDNYITYYSTSTSKTTNQDGSITISYKTFVEGTSNAGTEEASLANGSSKTNTYYKYNTANGQKGSTTGNIYGIYDMAGGAWEYTASYLKEITSNSHVTTFNSKPSSYVTGYLGTGDLTTEGRNSNYNLNKNIYGDGIWEISNDGATGNKSWNLDCSTVLSSSNPFFARGYSFGASTGAGVFAFASYQTGAANTFYGFRIVLLPIVIDE